MARVKMKDLEEKKHDGMSRDRGIEKEWEGGCWCYLLRECTLRIVGNKWDRRKCVKCLSLSVHDMKMWRRRKKNGRKRDETMRGYGAFFKKRPQLWSIFAKRGTSFSLIEIGKCWGYIKSGARLLRVARGNWGILGDTSRYDKNLALTTTRWLVLKWIFIWNYYGAIRYWDWYFFNINYRGIISNKQIRVTTVECFEFFGCNFFFFY